MKTQQGIGLFPESPGASPTTPGLHDASSGTTAISTKIEWMLRTNEMLWYKEVSLAQR